MEYRQADQTRAGWARAMSQYLPLDRLTPWLTANIDGFLGPISVSTFGVGQSNPTFGLTTPAGKFVLRGKPVGDLLPSAHAVDREFRILSALYPTGFPVPRPIALCEDATVTGSIFYVMELVDGRVLRNGRLDGMSPGERRAIYEALPDTLAALHRLEPGEIGLSDYGRPGNYYERQLDRWSRQYQSACIDGGCPEMANLIIRLPSAIPKIDRMSIVHGDFRLDNMVLDHSAAQVRAVLDWELSTLGDPLGDLAFMLISWIAPAHLTPNNSGFADQEPHVLGIPTLDEIVARYARAAGRIDLPQLEWRLAFNLFRLAAIYEGIAARARAGNATGADAASYGDRVAPLAALARRYLI